MVAGFVIPGFPGEGCYCGLPGRRPWRLAFRLFASGRERQLNGDVHGATAVVPHRNRNLHLLALHRLSVGIAGNADYLGVNPRRRGWGWRRGWRARRGRGYRVGRDWRMRRYRRRVDDWLRLRNIAHDLALVFIVSADQNENFVCVSKLYRETRQLRYIIVIRQPSSDHQLVFLGAKIQSIPLEHCIFGRAGCNVGDCLLCQKRMSTAPGLVVQVDDNLSGVRISLISHLYFYRYYLADKRTLWGSCNHLQSLRRGWRRRGCRCQSWRWRSSGCRRRRRRGCQRRCRQSV